MTIVFGIAGGGGVALDGGLMAVRAAREPIRKFLRLDCPMLRYGELRAMTQSAQFETGRCRDIHFEPGSASSRAGTGGGSKRLGVAYRAGEVRRSDHHHTTLGLLTTLGSLHISSKGIARGWVRMEQISSI